MKSVTKKKKMAKKTIAKATSSAQLKSGPACELCGKRKNVMQTQCCGHWICDDEENYVMFSFARNSCDRNHRRYTLCGSHFSEGHSGRWQDCKKCREGFKPEMVAYYGTNEFNFEKMEDPPTFEPTKCAKCKKRIDLGHDGYSMRGSEHFCMRCSALALRT